MNTPEAESEPLAGLNVLVVEDEAIISFLIEDMLLSLGCASVAHAGTVKQAINVLSAQMPDAAVLDVNLAGESGYAVAEKLEEGGIPFVFATGYGETGLPARWRERPVIQKPFTLESLGSALRTAF
jgi:CheY-like chemotaxis protein